MTRKDLIKAAKELNEILGLEPEISTEQNDEKLKEDLMTAAELLEPEDELSERTLNTIKQLTTEQGQAALSEQEDAEVKAPAKPKAKPGFAYKGAMTQYIDELLFNGGHWDILVAKAKKEAENRGVDPKKYTVATLRQHVKYRIKHGFPGKGHLPVEMTDSGVSVNMKGE